MDLLPQDVVDIIYDYKHSAEHYDLFTQVRQQIIHTYWMTRKLLVNYQFRSIFFPNFYSTLFILPPDDEDEEPDT
jgi:hypothetical protein